MKGTIPLENIENLHRLHLAKARSELYQEPLLLS